MRRISLTAAALGAAAVAVFVATLPPGSNAIAVGGAEAGTWRGAFHVHTRKSDGTGDVESVARAAARAGLEFVIFTDHGDGTAPPQPPRYVNGVLCIEGVEISTAQGHYIALGMAQAPYPLGGDARSVVEDVRRLGGFGVVAHPDSPKAELEWDGDVVETDGIEWLNADSAWRDESAARLALAGLQSLLKPTAALVALLDRPAAALAAWDAATRLHPVVALAGADAHGGAGERSAGEDAGGFGGIGAVPYEVSFRAFTNTVLLGRRATWDAARDAADLLDAIAAGRVYSSIDGRAKPATLRFWATRAGSHAVMGQAASGHGAAGFHVQAGLPERGVLVLLRQGAEVARSSDGTLEFESAEPGAYRVEGRMAGDEDAAPWLVSNPIYVDLPPEAAPAARVAAVPPPGRAIAGADATGVVVGGWHAEHDPASFGEVQETAGGSATLAYRLRAGERASQYVALAAPVSGAERAGGVAFTVSATRPCRVSVQVRASGEGDRRWVRSIYVDTTGRPVVLPFDEFRPVAGNPAAGAFEPASISSILLVLDLVNTAPGATGSLTVTDLRFIQSGPSPALRTVSPDEPVTGRAHPSSGILRPSASAAPSAAGG